jgi:hypothetical protein
MNDLVEQYKQNQDILLKYKENDLINLPGWTFFIPSIIESYGLCPYLNVEDGEFKNRRIKWITDSFDRGKFYYSIVEKSQKVYSFSNEKNETVQKLKDTITFMVKDSLVEYNKHVVQYNSQNTSDENFKHLVEYNELITSIEKRTLNSCMNKKSKSEWYDTLKIIDDIGKVCHYNFLLYTKIIHDKHIRHKPIFDISSEIQDKLEHIQSIFQLYDNESNNKNNLEQTCKSSLVELIKNNFQIDQIGKYFKRWSSLSIEKKAERIQSYIEWFIRENNLNFNFYDNIYKFVIEKLNSKELKVNDIKWNSRNGIITFINIVIDGNGVSSLSIKKVSIVQKKKKTSNFDNLNPSRKGKIHRLLLFEILKSNHICKTSIIQVVLNNVSKGFMDNDTQDVILKYTTLKYEEFLDYIKKNPIPDNLCSSSSS